MALQTHQSPAVVTFPTPAVLVLATNLLAIKSNRLMLATNDHCQRKTGPLPGSHDTSEQTHAMQEIPGFFTWTMHKLRHTRNRRSVHVVLTIHGIDWKGFLYTSRRMARPWHDPAL
uniref:Uncharacterized protein n=1 Tax=Anopheles farauti TaxID=69004 RepID=A0A182QTX2_9DIPT